MPENKIGRRKWVKLWVDDWLEGTTRFEMNGAQRAFWIDLLAMAGRSREPGIVFAGYAGDRAIGYPLMKFQILVSDGMDVAETLALFQRTNKIKMYVEPGNPPLYTIAISNWEKFQSEYHRQKKYRTKPGESDDHAKRLQLELQSKLQGKLQPELQQQLQPRLHGDYGVEVEVEGEVEVKTKALVHQKTVDARAATPNFTQFWDAYPRKDQKNEARKAMVKMGGMNGHFPEIMAALEVWKRCDQWQEPRYIPLAKNWISKQMWLDRPASAAVPLSPREFSARRDSQVGAGPSDALPAPTHCKHCGQTQAYHSRPIKNIQHENPKWNPHKFEADV